MTFAERAKNFFFLITGLAFSAMLLWYGAKTTKHQILLPPMLRESLPLPEDQSQKKIVKLSVDKVTPYPSEENISTFPNIAATTTDQLGSHSEVTISPKTSFTNKIASDRRHLTIQLQKPLKPSTIYTVSIDDPEVPSHYQWSFKTGSVAIDQKMVSAIDRVKQQMPYSDPNDRFAIFYASQTDVYFATVHNDERSESDRQAALAWFRSQGITDEKSLQITWIASDAF